MGFARRRFARHILLAAITFTGATLLALGLAEVGLRIRERVGGHAAQVEGLGGRAVPDQRWGWKPAPGWFRVRTGEFVAEGTVNADFMNDRPIVPAEDRGAIRLFVVGDSHTYAVGVSQHETWPRRLEVRLNAPAAAATYRTYNAGTIGYSLHQYLLRVIDQAPRLEPRVILMGLSFATDLFDLLPPDRGGWVYGGNLERDYFDFDASGRLEARHWSPRATGPQAVPVRGLAARRLRASALNLATVRLLRRSPLSMLVASRLRLEDYSIWPNMDIVMEREISPSHAYQHRLFRALLAALVRESAALGARLVVIGIPYLPQIYPDLSRAVFGTDRYDADAMSRRVAAYCAEAGAAYVDTLPAFRTAHAASGRWLHYREDGHPTPEGHEIIAHAVQQAGVLPPPEAAARHEPAGPARGRQVYWTERAPH